MPVYGVRSLLVENIDQIAPWMSSHDDLLPRLNCVLRYAAARSSVRPSPVRADAERRSCWAPAVVACVNVMARDVQEPWAWLS